ncbi:MAG: TlpA family protein disulfide reductase [Nitrospinae bacterium]|nr:TlpA family protein disulfide reductase [Nitrospinota bacterium]
MKEQEAARLPRSASRARLALVVVAILATVAIVLVLKWPDTEVFQPMGKGIKAQDFAFKTIEGETVALEDFRGQVVLINIWATWCVPCRDEMPSLERLYNHLRGRRFVILAISIDRNAQSVKFFKDEFDLPFPILLDPRGRITRLYGTNGVPESFLIDGSGVITERVIGGRNWADEVTVQRIVKLVEQAEGASGPGSGRSALKPTSRTAQ